MARRGPAQFQKFLAARSAGEVVTEQQILTEIPDWKKSSLDTYRRKHKLDGFMSYLGNDQYRIVRGGPAVSESDINAALSQITPPALSFARGDILKSESTSYTLLRDIGRGAVGTVWSATSSQTDGEVAVKICNPRPDLLEVSILANVQARFRRESRLGPRVTHASIVRYLDVGEHHKAPFLVMELAKESLRERLERVGRFSIPEAASVACSVIEGLAHLAQHNCVHRDIKPANILATERGYVLGDLGILRWGDLNRDFTGAGTITKATVQLGSWNYMAPEQLVDPHAVSSATDIYALGVTMIELLTGSVPVAQVVAAGRVPPPSSCSELNELIVRMTAFEQAERPTLDRAWELFRGLRPNIESAVSQ